MKISPDGNKIWEFTGCAGVVGSVAIDNQGNVYSGLYDRLIKVSPNGQKIWEFTWSGGTVQTVAVDSQGYVYLGSDDKKVMKLHQNIEQILTGYEVLK